MNYEVVPISYKLACEVVLEYHRHHKPPQGHKFSIGLDSNGLHAVVMVGRPVAREYDDGRTLEITRICTIDNAVPNSVSILLGAICRAGKALGYKRIITYTLESEHGSSLKASNFSIDGTVRGRSWSTPSRIREDKHPLDNKTRWIRKL